MKYFITSDIHSFYTPFIEALEESGFDINNPEHILVVNGDLFDRGEETIKLLNYIKALPKERRILIRGNHEYLLIDLLNKTYPQQHDWSNGTVFTCYHLYTNLYPKSELVRKYKDVRALEKNWIALMDWIEVQAFNYVMELMLTKSMWTRMCNEIKKSGIIDWIKSDEWVDYFEVGDYIITHSFIPLEKRVSTYFDDRYDIIENWRELKGYAWIDATWGCPYRLFDLGLFNKEIERGKTLVCGHWHCSDFHLHYESKYSIQGRSNYENSMNEIYYGDNLIAIDGCTVISGIVNVLVIDNGKLYNQHQQELTKELSESRLKLKHPIIETVMI